MRERRILFNYAMYFLCFIIVCIVGISNVFGLEYIDIGNYADITVVLVSTDYGDAPFNVPKDSAYNFTQVLEIDYHVNNFNFEANKNYQLESHLTQQQLTNANYYTVQGLNGEQCLISYDNSYFTGAYPRWAFQCPHPTNSITLSIKNSNNQYLWASGQTNIFTWTTALLKYSNTSLSGNDSSNDSIINNNNQNTQDIINNQNQNTQDLIDNNNANTDKIIENNQVCDIVDKSDKVYDGYLYDNGQIGTNLQNMIVTKYFSVDENSKIIKLDNTLTNAAYRICFYDSNYNYISCMPWQQYYQLDEIPVPDNSNYVRFTINTENNVPKFKICKNGNQALDDSIKDLTGALTDDSPVDISGLSDTAGWLPPGPIDSIINLPLNFLNGLLNALNKTCAPLSVPIPYINQNISIPCISTIFNKITGVPALWAWVGGIASVVILYKYLLALYKYYDDLTTMKANFISDFGGAP